MGTLSSTFWNIPGDWTQMIKIATTWTREKNERASERIGTNNRCVQGVHKLLYGVVTKLKRPTMMCTLSIIFHTMKDNIWEYIPCSYFNFDEFENVHSSY